MGRGTCVDTFKRDLLGGSRNQERGDAAVPARSRIVGRVGKLRRQKDARRLKVSSKNINADALLGVGSVHGEDSSARGEAMETRARSVGVCY